MRTAVGVFKLLAATAEKNRARELPLEAVEREACRLGRSGGSLCDAVCGRLSYTTSADQPLRLSQLPPLIPERPAARRRTLDGYGQFLFLDDDAPHEPCAMGPGLPEVPRERSHTA